MVCGILPKPPEPKHVRVTFEPSSAQNKSCTPQATPRHRTRAAGAGGRDLRQFLLPLPLPLPLFLLSDHNLSLGCDPANDRQQRKLGTGLRTRAPQLFDEPEEPMLPGGQLHLELLLLLVTLLLGETAREEEGDSGVLCSLLHHDDRRQ